MSDHLSIHQIRRYHRRRLSPAELLSTGDHLAACGECRERVLNKKQLAAETQRLWMDLKAEGEAEHLSYEQLASYVNGSLDKFDRVIVDSHLGVCPSCAEEAGSLLEFSRRLDQRRDDRAVSRPAAYSIHRPAWMSATRAAAAGAFLCLCVVAGLYLIRRVPEQHVQSSIQTNPEGGLAVTSSRQDAPTAEPSPSPAQTFEAHKSPEQGQGATAVEVGEKPRASGTEAQAQALVSLLDGGRQVVLDSGGDLRGLEELPTGLRKTLRAALLSRQLRKPGIVEELYGGPLRLLGEASADNAFTPISPVGTVVLDVRPTFRWSPLSGTDGYVVEVYDPELNPVATSGVVTTTEWRVDRPLRRGVVYRWQVTALKGGERVRSPKPPAPEAKFKVLEDHKAAELADVNRLAPNSHLAQGVLYALAGLADDSERELRSLLKENPRSGVAKRMLESIRSWRR